MFCRKAPLASRLELPTQPSVGSVHGIETAVVTHEIDCCVRHCRRGSYAAPRLERPFLCAGGNINRIEIMIRTADIQSVSHYGGRGEHQALGLKLPFDLREFLNRR